MKSPARGSMRGPVRPRRNRISLRMCRGLSEPPADPHPHPSPPICTPLLAPLRARFIVCALPCPHAQFPMFAAIPRASSLPASPASRRDADRKRKRVARQFSRELGAPDPRQLDAAIVNALRTCSFHLLPQAGLGRGSASSLVTWIRRRSFASPQRLRGRESGGMSLQPEAIRAALVARFAPSSEPNECSHRHPYPVRDESYYRPQLPCLNYVEMPCGDSNIRLSQG